jgi:hypothetical protein
MIFMNLKEYNILLTANQKLQNIMYNMNQFYKLCIYLYTHIRYGEGFCK